MLPVTFYQHIFWSSDILHGLDWFGSFLSTQNSGKERLCVSLQVWVVSQKEKRQEQVQIHVRVDAYDEFCLLMRTPRFDCIVCFHIFPSGLRWLLPILHPIIDFKDEWINFSYPVDERGNVWIYDDTIVKELTIILFLLLLLLLLCLVIQDQQHK
mmetsp:Transcript_2636/g.3828  ORF Transcript_2636/g.3828 Transcript_2636/m.3828 type:complete len:155 (-) Transcript_2636:349-813(-)